MIWDFFCNFKVLGYDGLGLIQRILIHSSNVGTWGIQG